MIQRHGTGRNRSLELTGYRIVAGLGRLTYPPSEWPNVEKTKSATRESRTRAVPSISRMKIVRPSTSVAASGVGLDSVASVASADSVDSSSASAINYHDLSD